LRHQVRYPLSVAHLRHQVRYPLSVAHLRHSVKISKAVVNRSFVFDYALSENVQKPLSVAQTRDPKVAVVHREHLVLLRSNPKRANGCD
jgi:hypothetical protein